MENKETLVKIEQQQLFSERDIQLKLFAQFLDQTFSKNKKPEYKGWFTLSQYNKEVRTTKNSKDLIIALMTFGYLKIGKIEGITKYKAVLNPLERVKLLSGDIILMNQNKINLEGNIKLIGDNINFTNNLINYIQTTNENADNTGNVGGNTGIEETKV